MLTEKVNSHVVSAVQLGIDKLRSIDPELDLGNGLTLTALMDDLQATREAFAEYNTAAAELRKKGRAIKTRERQLRTHIKQMVMGVGARYGEDSEEFAAVQKLWKLTKRTRPAPNPAPGSETTPIAD
jgi:hypothetical protein